MELTIRTFEDPKINNTNLSAEDVALANLRWFGDGLVIAGLLAIYPSTSGPALKPNYDYPGFLVYDTVLRGQLPQDFPGRTPQPIITNDNSGNVTLELQRWCGGNLLHARRLDAATRRHERRGFNQGIRRAIPSHERYSCSLSRVERSHSPKRRRAGDDQFLTSTFNQPPIMALDRSLLTRGPAIVTYGGNTFYTNADILSRFGPAWNPVNTSMYGQVDKVLVDRVYKLPLRLWGAWENLSVLFPSYAMSPQVGASIFGTTATPLVILARNGDQITYANAQITKLANLFLGVDSELFAADVEFTCIIGNSSGSTMFNPEDANAYYTSATGQAYSDGAFAKTNFKRVRFTGAWGAIAGFTSVIPQRGFQVSWDLDVRPLTCDGLGTVDFTIGENVLQGTCTCVPIQPTMAELEAQGGRARRAAGHVLERKRRGPDTHWKRRQPGGRAQECGDRRTRLRVRH